MMNRNREDIAIDITQTLGEFTADLRECVFPKEDSKDILLVEFFFRRMDKLKIAEHVTKHILPYKKQILGKKQEFFIDKKYEIFKGLPLNKIDYYADIVMGKSVKGIKISDENSKIVWEFFETLVTLAEEYEK